MKTEFAIKNWLNKQFDEISGFKNGLDYRGFDLNETRKIIKIIEDIDKRGIGEEVLRSQIKMKTFLMGPYRVNITNKSIEDITKRLLNEYKSLVRQYKLKYLFEFSKFKRTIL